MKRTLTRMKKMMKTSLKMVKKTWKKMRQVLVGIPMGRACVGMVFKNRERRMLLLLPLLGKP